MMQNFLSYAVLLSLARALHVVFSTLLDAWAELRTNQYWPPK